jgi:AcrR family transcriptional regulator
VERADRLRKTPRQARSRSTVEAILAAADRVLRSEGYGAASTNRMARVAGFSVGSLYQYFDDKQAVIGALVDQALRAEAERVAEALDAAAGLSPEAACDRTVRVLLAERRSKAHLLRILDVFSLELGAAPPSSEPLGGVDGSRRCPGQGSNLHGRCPARRF